MAPLKRIMLLIETSSAYGRGLLEGIGAYAESHGQWSLYIEERAIGDEEPAWLRNWKGDGVIFRSYSQTMLNAIRSRKIPAVETNSKFIGHEFPLVYIDDRSVASMAVEHFTERGFDHFGFCSVDVEPWVAKRRSTYVDELKRSGRSCHVWSVSESDHHLPWAQQSQRLLQWLQQIPKPIAVFAANDVTGIRLIDTCLVHGVAVPEEIAILGVDNDTMLNRLCRPPLSSIDLNATRIGYEAAKLLDRMIAGESPPVDSILIPPLGVQARQSTDITAVNDPVIAAALTYIRENACSGISVVDIVDALAVSRATLERRFDAHLGRTPKQEIDRVRMKAVERYLRLTDYPLAEIANRTGYGSPFHLSGAYKRNRGISPSEFRSQYQQGF